MNIPRNPSEENFWSGGFGDSYTKRNRVDWRKRIPFWTGIIELTGVRSVYEFGCNAGWNLSAIQRCYPDVNLTGEEINDLARRQASTCGLNTVWTNSSYLNSRTFANENTFELVFTAGVLIHIAPDQLKKIMQDLVTISCDYVLAIEYASDKEEMIPYRGYENKLWKRPYGKLYQEMGLELVASGDAEGFDRCTYWLLRKP